ncbi:tudor domain-containing protein 3-like isoform X2 [Dysidea avara]|uniref:tudor domain-containing protein 3-like isoform X2 n=1 Tax=Dysidea avara TaxID=196820 RepID=UPI00332316CD
MTELGVKSALSKEGWSLSEKGYDACTSACAEKKTPPGLFTSLHEVALNQDLRAIGSKCLSDTIPRGVPQEVQSPVILQVQKIINIASPSCQQNEGGTRLLKLQLTDGYIYCNALEIKHTPQLNLSVPPGTKLKITSNVMARNGFLLLTPSVVKVLGGHVEHMVEKWKASKIITQRGKVARGEGPPAFVPFSEVTSKRQHTTKSSDQPKGKQTTKPTPLSQKQAQQEYETRPSFKATKETAVQPKIHQSKGSTLSHKQAGDRQQQQYDKPRPYHDKEYHDRQPQHNHGGGKSQGRFQHHFGNHERPHQHERYHGKPPRDRPHNPQYTRTTKDNSHGQPLSDFLPTTFHSGEEYFPPLSHSKVPSQPQHGMKNEPHKPMLAWDAPQGPITGGSVPFSAKQMK